MPRDQSLGQIVPHRPNLPSFLRALSITYPAKGPFSWRFLGTGCLFQDAQAWQPAALLPSREAVGLLGSGAYTDYYVIFY